VFRSHYRSCKLIVSFSQTLADREGAGTASASLKAKLDRLEELHHDEQEELKRDARARAEIIEDQLITRMADNDAMRTADSIHGAHMTQCEWKKKKDAEDKASSYVGMEAAYKEVRQAQYRLDKVMSCAAKSWRSYRTSYPGEEALVASQLFERNMSREEIESLMKSLAEFSTGVQEDGGQEGTSETVVPGKSEPTSMAHW